MVDLPMAGGCQAVIASPGVGAHHPVDSAGRIEANGDTVGAGEIVVAVRAKVYCDHLLATQVPAQPPADSIVGSVSGCAGGRKWCFDGGKKIPGATGGGRQLTIVVWTCCKAHLTIAGAQKKEAEIDIADCNWSVTHRHFFGSGSYYGSCTPLGGRGSHQAAVVAGAPKAYRVTFGEDDPLSLADRDKSKVNTVVLRYSTVLGNVANPVWVQNVEHSAREPGWLLEVASAENGLEARLWRNDPGRSAAGPVWRSRQWRFQPTNVLRVDDPASGAVSHGQVTIVPA